MRETDVQRLIDAWVASQVGMLDAAESAALDAEQPGWRAAAAQLIAEGLLAYVAVEMVAPDLAILAASGTPSPGDDTELTARLGAHVRDFVDYRADLDELREQLGPEAAPGRGHDGTPPDHAH